MSSVMEAVAELFQQDAEAKAAKVAEIARGIATGRIDDPVEIQTALCRLNFSQAELDKHVQYIAQRVEWVRQGDGIRQAEIDLADADAKLAANEARRKAVNEEIDAENKPLLARSADATQRRNAGYNALTQLRATYKGPLLAALADAQAERRQYAQTLTQLKERRASINWNLRGPHRQVNPLSREDHERVSKKLADVDRQIQQTTDALAECDRQAREIERAMLQA